MATKSEKKSAAPNKNHSFLPKLPSPLSAKLEIKPIPHLSSPASHMSRIMSRIDEDGDGKISPCELRNCVLASGEDVAIEEIEKVVEFVDSDGDGMLGLEDLMRFASGEGEEERRGNLKEAFRAYEVEGEGFIDATSLRDALGRLGERRTVEECEIMVRSFDLDGDGVLSFEEFEIMMEDESGDGG